MFPTQDAKLSVEDTDLTVASSGEREVTTFVANEFWQVVSETNGNNPIPSDLDS